MAKLPNWQRELLRARSGKPLPLLANAITAFRRAPEWQGRLRFNEFSQKLVLLGRPPWAANTPEDRAAAEEWTSAHDLLATEWLQRAGVHVSPDTTAQAAECVGREQPFHPVRDHLETCQWDGVPRLDEWLIRYLGAPDTSYTRAVATRWLISAVARIYRPGCKADCCLILEGSQGLRKSTALKTIGAPWFTDELADLGSKDAALQLAGAWIVELAELDGLNRGDVARIKAFMSRTTDRYRPPYGRRVVEQPRQCVFAGTVNHDDYLRDETGGRRFWPVRCTRIDIDGLAAVRDQLWAEAKHRFDTGEVWWLETMELTQVAGEEQQQRYQGDPWDDVITAYARPLPSVSVPEVLEKALGLARQQWSQKEQNRVARCLKARGWRREQARVAGERQWRYFPPSSAAPVETGDTDDSRA